MTFFDTSAPLLPEILALHGKWKADKKALIFGKECISWHNFNKSTNQIANGLISHGISKGDMVGVLMTNGRQMVEAIIGIMKSGAASVPINLSVSDEALAAMLDDAGVTTIIATADQADRLTNYDTCAFKLAILKAEGKVSDDFEAFKNSHATTKPIVTISPDAPLNVIYSSGTTGTPKGILHTHQGRRDWAYDLAVHERCSPSDYTPISVGLVSSPPYWQAAHSLYMRHSTRSMPLRRSKQSGSPTCRWYLFSTNAC